MKKKKRMAACLAGALVMSSVIVPGQASVKAEGKSLTDLNCHTPKLLWFPIPDCN